LVFVSKFLLRRISAGFKFDLKASNGQTIATSEVYDTRAACLKGIKSVQNCAPVAGVEDQTVDFRPLPHPKFELFQDKAGQFRFRLKARNGKVIAVSEGYAAKAGCENGIESVRENAPDAQLSEK
jgi:uncharacterized protein YegP (UPF0339 family)